MLISLEDRDYPQVKQTMDQRLATVTTSSQILPVSPVKLVAPYSVWNQWHLHKEILLSRYSGI